ncbi:hypothetical protein B6259_05925 [Ruminococcaceae bacterium CPB6]|jgi:hypothetical protein|nr:hypothetical protein B6259_05925 [Ruminococcaceae bacterium CPB6]
MVCRSALLQQEIEVVEKTVKKSFRENEGVTRYDAQGAPTETVSSSLDVWNDHLKLVNGTEITV